MAKLFIDPGHGGRDPGAVGNGLLEKELNLDIALRLYSIVTREHPGIEVRLSRDRDIFISLGERAAMANQWGADLVLSIHINAGGGTGYESYIHRSRPAATARWQQMIHQEVMNNIGPGIRDRGMKTANFAILRQTRMPAILTENLFIDHPQDAQRLKDTAFRQRLAECYAAGVAKIFGIKLAAPSSQQPRPETAEGVTYYRVVAGSFTNLENAERRVKALKEAGFDAFIDEYRN